MLLGHMIALPPMLRYTYSDRFSGLWSTTCRVLFLSVCVMGALFVLNNQKSDAGQADRLVLRLSCPVDVEEPRLLCQAMVQELAAAVRSSVVRIVPQGEETPTRAADVGVAFSVSDVGTRGMKGRLDWQIGQGPRQTGAETQLSVMDTSLSPKMYRNFARSLVLANENMLKTIELNRIGD